MTKSTVEFLNKWCHELLGECWHEYIGRNDYWICKFCEASVYENHIPSTTLGCVPPNDFRLKNYCHDRNLSAKVVEKTDENVTWRIGYAWNLAEIAYQCEVTKKDTYIHIDIAGAMAKATAEQEVRAVYATMEEK